MGLPSIPYFLCLHCFGPATSHFYFFHIIHCSWVCYSGFLGPFTNFVFPWAFTDFIGLPRPNYFILILGVYGPAINPILSLLALLWACHSPFLLFSHHTLLMGLLLTISLFPGSFEPICFLKAHLLISWTCDPLFLLLGLSGFCSPSFANFLVLLGWASFLTFGFHKKKKTLNNYFSTLYRNSIVWVWFEG